MALLLVLTFSVGLGYQTFTVAYFYWNRAEIAEQYCVNKDKPRLNCHGKCHLEKQLTGEKNAPDNQKTAPPAALSFWLFGVELIVPFQFSFFDATENRHTIYLTNEPGSTALSLFVPPDLS